jgi:hypothetical protein
LVTSAYDTGATSWFQPRRRASAREVITSALAPSQNITLSSRRKGSAITREAL